MTADSHRLIRLLGKFLVLIWFRHLLDVASWLSDTWSFSIHWIHCILVCLWYFIISLEQDSSPCTHLFVHFCEELFMLATNWPWFFLPPCIRWQSIKSSSLGGSCAWILWKKAAGREQAAPWCWYSPPNNGICCLRKWWEVAQRCGHFLVEVSVPNCSVLLQLACELFFALAFIKNVLLVISREHHGADVHFVDYGWTEMVQGANIIHEVPQVILEWPPQCMRYQLVGVLPVGPNIIS